MDSIKQCSKCRQSLPLSAFHRRRHYVKGGYRAACKACTRQASQQKQATDPPSPLARLKTRVRARTRAAIRRGQVRVHLCRICGAAAQAHHPDYMHPEAHLRIDWLCPTHHAAEHGIRPWTRQLDLPGLASG